MNQIWQIIKPLPDLLWRWFERIVITLGGRTIAMLSVALLIAISSIIFSDNWLVSINRQVEMIRLVRVNIATLHQLKADLFEAESAQRGYIITKRIVYVAPFNAALNSARANVKLSEKLVIDTSTDFNQAIELEWLKAISASIEAKSAEMLLTIRLVDANKIEQANQVVNLDLGRLQMQKFVQQTDKLIKQQNANVDSMIEKRSATVVMARISIIGSTLLLILLVVLVIKQLLNELAIKSQLQQQVVKENEIYEGKLFQQTKLLRNLALGYQADVERERQKLSRELHDELGSIFTATKMDIAWVIKKITASAPDIAEKLKKTSSYVDQGIAFQRHIVQELHPAMLTTFGFWPALNSLITDAAERNHWQLTLNLPDENTKLNETISLVAYRIVQETLNNAHKYAKATAVSVDVIVDEQHVKLEIQDNGVGLAGHQKDTKLENSQLENTQLENSHLENTQLENSKLEKQTTHGLAGMRHRVLAIGGRFEISSEPGQGVLTRALIPIDFETV